MSGISQKTYYWDSCMYLAWLKGETSHGNQHIQAMAQIAKDNFGCLGIYCREMMTRETETQ